MSSGGAQPADIGLGRLVRESIAYRTRLQRRWLASHLGEWLDAHRLGYINLWRTNSLGLAARLTLFNLLGIRRRFDVSVYGFNVTLRSGTPDFSVAIESLGRELDAVTCGHAHEPAALIIDAGGYIGTAAMKLATAYPDCRIICIEPSSENIELLRINVAAYPNVTVLKAALAATVSEVALRDPGRRQWGFTIVAETSRNDAVLETVATTTIEAILSEHGFDRVFILKLDVEGAEVELFGNSAGWMPRTDIVVVELHEWIVEGSEASFHAATRDRVNRSLDGEKVLSLHPGCAVAVK